MDGVNITPAEAARVLLSRRKAKASFLFWCEQALEPYSETPAKHHRMLIEKLEAVERGEIKRLMVMMPPGSAKTRYGTVLFPPWFLARRPNRKVIVASYASDVAEANSGKIIRMVAEAGSMLGIGCENEAVSRWRTTNGGEVLAAGVGSRVTSFRGDLVIIDDPVKGRKEADSDTIRDDAWKWFWADVHSRLTPGAAVVLIMTRWHEDDIAGRFLETAGGDWVQLKLPAEALDEDPLGRERGEFLWSGDPNYDYGGALRAKKEDLRKSGSMREWESLYQQNPRPGEGALFDVKQIRIIPAAPSGGKLVRAYDFAATEQLGTRDSDWSVGALMQETEDKHYVIREVIRERFGPAQLERWVLQTAQRDGRAVKIFIPQDPAQAGKFQAFVYGRLLRGYHLKTERVGGNKSMRAAPFASQVSIGNVSMVAGAWNKALLDELGGFPSASHDDQVDALSDAFAELVQGGTPTRQVYLDFMGR